MRKLILLSGKQGSGKSSTADSLTEALKERGHVYRTRYARILYLMHDAVRDIGRQYGMNLPDKNGFLLQILGTEWGRQKVDDNVWVNCVKADITKALETAPKDKPFYVVMDDLRFKNEFTGLEDFAKENGFELVRIRLEADRDTRKARCDGWRDTENHISETDLDDMIGQFELCIETDKASKEEALQAILEHINGYL